MVFSPDDRQFHRTHPGYYEPTETKRAVRSCENVRVTEQLHKVSIRGQTYPEGLRLHLQSSRIPDTPRWSIVGRHDMFCGIFNSSGDKFFSGSHDGVVRIFDSSTRFFQLLTEIECPSQFWSVISLSLSPNERQLVYSVLSERIQLVTFDENGATPRNTVIDGGLRGGGYDSHDSLSVAKTFTVSFDGSGTRILAGHNSGVVQVYDVGDGRCVHSVSCSHGYRDVNALTTVDQSGHVFLTGSDDTNIRLFDLRTMNKGPLAVFTGHVDGITYLDSKGDSTYFLSNCKDQRVKLWDLRKHTKPGKERHRKSRFTWDYRYHAVPNSYFDLDHDRPIRGDNSVLTLRGHIVRFSLIRVRFSPAHSTGQRFAYAGSGYGAWPIWDLFTGKPIQTNWTGAHAIRDVHWHPWDSVAVSSGMDGSLTYWTHEDSKSDSVGSDSLTGVEDPRKQLSSLDPEGERYEHPLARSGLRYRFPGECAYGLSPSSSESSYFELIRYVTDNTEDEDDTFLTLTGSSDTQSEFGLPLSEFSDENDEEFDPHPYEVADLEFELDQVQRRPVTRSQTRSRPRIRQRAKVYSP
ncbi:DDB1-and CUL4-associated factor 11 [Fasciola gigantica]|uniref:DDB1-and CUL4-associated factor 11 n=1 Tax=Fasciola gigantica TaxID=46835 RepID=A0A504Z1E3_FASGI|nr:DDB1-and CUL4-associated factor 11 [Fasciola gigantica]